MKKVRIITHSGNFHPDELFAVATLLLHLDLSNDKYEINRSRDPEIINTGDYVVDIGGVLDPESNKFDHHQKGGGGARPNGVPYASFGLVWKKYGAELCSSQEAADRVDEKLIQAIDAEDNGVQIVESINKNVKPYQFETAISSFIPTWKEKDKSIDMAFLKVLVLVEEVLAREITRAKHFLEGKSHVLEAYKEAPDKRMIVIKDAYAWKDILNTFPEPLYVVANDGRRPEWAVAGIREEGVSFKTRKLFPESWGGKRDAELEKVTGVKGAIFCHNGRHLVIAKDFEAATKLAQIAIGD